MNVYAVIITFNPDVNTVVRLVEQLSRQNVSVVIVDNNSKNKHILDMNTSEHIIFLDVNMGIAKAQNVGIEYAIQNQADYIVFFDQDSSISDNYIMHLISDYIDLQRRGLSIGAIGPRFIDGRYNFYYKTISLSKFGFRTKIEVSNISHPIHSSLLISSGSLVSIDTLKNVGLMREIYFIDYVDTEWCIRAESRGYKNYISAKAVMHHTIGDNIKQNKWFKIPVHSSFRRYYIVRNSFYMLKEPYIPKFFAFHQLIINIIHQFIIIYTVKGNRFDYFKKFLKGIKDGLKYLI